MALLELRVPLGADPREHRDLLAPQARDPATGDGGQADLRSPRLWLVLAACLTASGGGLAAYSYVAPILTDQGGHATGLVPAVLAGYGICPFLGTLLGGRLGDKHAHAVVIAAPALSAFVLMAMATLTGITWMTVLLVILLGPSGSAPTPC